MPTIKAFVARLSKMLWGSSGVDVDNANGELWAAAKASSGWSLTGMAYWYSGNMEF